VLKSAKAAEGLKNMVLDRQLSSFVITTPIGHDSEAMSAHYTSIGKESLAKAQEAMPAF
jgi:hypothetical protein